MLRADFGRIVVHTGANVLDGCVLHGGDDPITEIGAGATIGHLCVVHGCWIGPQALIGNGSTVRDGARIGVRCLVRAGATIAPGTVIPDGQLVLGSVGTIRGPLTRPAQALGAQQPSPRPPRGAQSRHSLNMITSSGT